MSVTSSSQWSAHTSLNRYKNGTRGRNTLLCDNVKNYPHRDSLVKKTSPIKVQQNMLASSSIDSTLLAAKQVAKVPHYAGVNGELVSEISIQLDSPSRIVGGSVTGGLISTANPPKPYCKRGNLLGPFKFMTSELEGHKLQHYNKGHLETVLRQLDLLQHLMVTKLEEDRRESELELMQAWMAVHQKEEEAFNICIKEKTAEEVHNVHNRLVEMERTMEKVCESLAPTFEKFASLNELKTAQKETENYVKSIKKFNVRTKINQEYSERILKLEKSINFLERTNERSNRMLQTPVVEQAKKIETSSLPASSSSSSGQKPLNRSASWTANKALEILATNSGESNNEQDNKSKTPTSKSVAVELQIPKVEKSSGSTGYDVTGTAAASSSGNGKSEEKVATPVKPPVAPVPFQERVLRPSWAKDKFAEEMEGAGSSEKKAEKVPFQEKVMRPSWAKDRPTLNVEEVAVTTSSANSTSTFTSNDSKGTASTVSVQDLAAAAMGISSASTSNSAISIKGNEEIKSNNNSNNNGATASLSSEKDNTVSEHSKNINNALSSPKANNATSSAFSAATSNASSNSNSVVGSPVSPWKSRKMAVEAEGANSNKTEEPSANITPASFPTTLPRPPAPPATTSTVVKTEKIIVEKKVLSRASWIKDTKKDSHAEESSKAALDSITDNIVVSRGSSNSDLVGSDSPTKPNRSSYVPKPDTKLPPPADIPASTVVKSIVSQINTSKTLNSSFYEKKLQQSKEHMSPETNFIQLARISESPDLELPPPVDLQSKDKKSWKDLSNPQYVPVPPVPEPVISTYSQKGHRRSNSGTDALDNATANLLTEKESVSSSKKTLTSSKSEYGKRWQEYSSRSNETAQTVVQANTTTTTTTTTTVNDGIPIRQQVKGASTALSVDLLSAPSTTTNNLPPLSPVAPISSNSNSNSGSAFSSNINSPVVGSSAKFQPRLSTNASAFSEPKTPSPSLSPKNTLMAPSPPVMIPGSPSQSNNPTSASAFGSPRITGSKGLISAISQNRKNAEANAGNVAGAGFIGMGVPGSPQGKPGHGFSNHGSPSIAVEVKSNPSDSIPTRNSMEFKDPYSPPHPSMAKSSPSLKAAPSMTRREFEMGMDETETEVVVSPKSHESLSSKQQQQQITRSHSGSSADEVGSSASGYTLDSNGQKRRRPTVKGFVKRVSSLLRTSSKKNVEDNNNVISEKNLTQQQLAYMNEKKQSFVEKKIGDGGVITTNTPASPVMKSIATTNDNDFSFIEHVKGDHDDLSSVGDSEDHNNSNKGPAAAPSSSSGKTGGGSAMPSTYASDSKDDSKSHTSLTKRISGLIRKTSSIFQKATGAPEPPPRPANLPPPASKVVVEKKSSNGIAAPNSSSFDVVPAALPAGSFEVKPILKNGSSRIPDHSLPVETNSLGTVDKMIQQQQQQEQLKKAASSSTLQAPSQEMEEVEGSEDKFDATTGAPKPRKFKPVKFLKKTFTSMTKMV